MYVTPDDANPAIVGFVVFLPADIVLIAAFAGAFETLALPKNWQEVGTMSPEDAAASFREAIEASFPLQEA